MKKQFLGITVAALVFSLGVCAADGFYPQDKAQAAGGLSAIEEKPLAGLSLSLDRYCECVLESAKEEEQKAQSEREQAEADDESFSSEESGKTTLTQTSKTAVDEEKTKRINNDLDYDNLGIADVDTYLNVRKSGSESAQIIGKMTKNAGCNVLKIKDGWAKIESGSVSGYVKAEYLLTGKEAQKKALKVARLKATVNTETLNVRYLPSTDSPIYDQIGEDEAYTVEEENLTEESMKEYIKKYAGKKALESVNRQEMYDDLKNWVMLSIDGEKVFVNKDFVTISYQLNTAKKISATASSSSSVGSSVASYAMQFLGNPYVWGGTSLTNGTDCSGFTQSVYAHFGYYLPRTSSAQAAATRTVSASEVQVGDLFFYGSNSSVSHVALYIGGGQIIHASNARDGIKISNAYYRQPIKIGRVI